MAADIYRCLGCSREEPASRLVICTAPHLEYFEEPTPIGPLCHSCHEAHVLAAHDGETPTWIN